MHFSRGKLHRTTTAYMFLLPTLLILGVFQFFPMFWALSLSLYDYSFLSPENPFVGLDNFRRMWHDPAFWQAFKNSFLYLLVVPVIIILSLLLALLVEPNLPFMNFFRACYYLPVVTMMVVVALAWKLIFDTDFGLLNHMLKQIGIVREGIPWLTSPNMALWTVMSVTVWKGLGYYMILFIVALKAVPKTLVEAAIIDGAKTWQVFLHVKLPSVWPIIMLTSILSSISALQVFEEIYVMTSGRIGTSTVVFEMYQTGLDMSQGTMQMGYACAIGVVLFGVLIVFSSVAIYLMEKVYKS